MRRICDNTCSSARRPVGHHQRPDVDAWLTDALARALEANKRWEPIGREAAGNVEGSLCRH
jgi:hypothetical protein